MVHGLDVTFAVATLFGIAALVMVGVPGPPAPGTEPTGWPPRSVESEHALAATGQAEFELVDGEGFGG